VDWKKEHDPYAWEESGQPHSVKLPRSKKWIMKFMNKTWLCIEDDWPVEKK
jgi:hypothetical protein